ncbi:unnamed protein product, partial [marine sediment metagenome]
VNIANKEQREQFLTVTYQDKTQTMCNRLRALELLGKGQGDYIEAGQQQGLVINIGKPEPSTRPLASPVSDLGLEDGAGQPKGQIGQPAGPQPPQGGAEGEGREINKGG